MYCSLPKELIIHSMSFLDDPTLCKLSITSNFLNSLGNQDHYNSFWSDRFKKYAFPIPQEPNPNWRKIFGTKFKDVARIKTPHFFVYPLPKSGSCKKTQRIGSFLSAQGDKRFSCLDDPSYNLKNVSDRFLILLSNKKKILVFNNQGLRIKKIALSKLFPSNLLKEIAVQILYEKIMRVKTKEIDKFFDLEDEGTVPLELPIIKGTTKPAESVRQHFRNFLSSLEIPYMPMSTYRGPNLSCHPMYAGPYYPKHSNRVVAMNDQLQCHLLVHGEDCHETITSSYFNRLFTETSTEFFLWDTSNGTLIRKYPKSLLTFHDPDKSYLYYCDYDKNEIEILCIDILTGLEIFSKKINWLVYDKILLISHTKLFNYTKNEIAVIDLLDETKNTVLKIPEHISAIRSLVFAGGKLRAFAKKRMLVWDFSNVATTKEKTFFEMPLSLKIGDLENNL